jgi:hypothetical protein
VNSDFQTTTWNFSSRMSGKRSLVFDQEMRNIKKVKKKMPCRLKCFCCLAKCPDGKICS